MDIITDVAGLSVRDPGMAGALVAAFGVSWPVALIIYVIIAIAWWRTFAKAGLPGILGIIPIVNVVFLVRIAGMSMWLALLYLIPIVNIVFDIVVSIKVGGRFGKGGAFSFFLLWWLKFIGYPILGFGSARYQGSAAL